MIVYNVLMVAKIAHLFAKMGSANLYLIAHNALLISNSSQLPTHAVSATKLSFLIQIQVAVSTVILHALLAIKGAAPFVNQVLSIEEVSVENVT